MSQSQSLLIFRELLMNCMQFVSIKQQTNFQLAMRTSSIQTHVSTHMSESVCVSVCISVCVCCSLKTKLIKISLELTKWPNSVTFNWRQVPLDKLPNLNIFYILQYSQLETRTIFHCYTLYRSCWLLRLLPFDQSFDLSVRLFVCPPVCLSVCFSVSRSVC